MMPQVYVNIFGRKPGRGIRPWLLLPKIIAVALYVGSLGGVIALLLASDFISLELADPRRQLVLQQVSRLIRFLVVPALLVAIIFGIALLLQHPRTFAAMRWLWVKLASLLILIPAAHLYCSTRLQLLREATNQSASNIASRQLLWGLTFALAGSVWVVIVGRLKPRLGQRYTAQPVKEATA